jgi:hypothetical protein
MGTWLESLEIGDLVITGKSQRVCKVERVTKTQIVLEKQECKFNRQTGRMIGGSRYYSDYLEEATKEKLDSMREERTRNLVSKKLRKLSENKKEGDNYKTIWELPYSKVKELSDFIDNLQTV